jgi:hypothetical protein
MNLEPILNKNPLGAQMESKLDVLGIAKKLVKFVIHLLKRKKLRKIYFSSHKMPKEQMTNFLVSTNFRD